MSRSLLSRWRCASATRIQHSRFPATVSRWGHSRGQNGLFGLILRLKTGAGDGDRTRYLNLGKVALCQMSYSRATSILFESESRTYRP